MYFVRLSHIPALFDVYDVTGNNTATFLVVLLRLYNKNADFLTNRTRNEIGKLLCVYFYFIPIDRTHCDSLVWLSLNNTIQ